MVTPSRKEVFTDDLLACEAVSGGIAVANNLTVWLGEERKVRLGGRIDGDCGLLRGWTQRAQQSVTRVE